MRSKIVKTVLIVIVCLAAMKGCTNLFKNGGVFETCGYAEQEIQIPESFAKGEILIEADGTIGEGFLPEFSCLPIMGKMPHHIMLAKDAQWFGKLKFTNDKHKLNVKFKPEKVVVVTKQGLFDHGMMFTYLLLKDEAGQSYSIAHVDVGLTAKESILKFVIGEQKQSLVMGNILRIQDFVFVPDSP